MKTSAITPRRIVTVVLAILVPAVPLVVALLLTGGGTSSGKTKPTSSGSKFTAVAQPTTPRTTGSSKVPAGKGAIVALVLRATGLRAAPSATAHKIAELPVKTSFGSPEFVSVSKVKGGWLGVIATQAGNNHLAWIRASATQLTRDPWMIHVHLSQHEVVVYHLGKAMEHYTIAEGKPSSPTPTGHFAVTDRLNTGDPGGPYGCCILATSALAPHHIADWNGGDRVAIHSTPETSSIGHSVSHGCMRLSLPDGRWLITHIPDGTPVTISSA